MPCQQSGARVYMAPTMWTIVNAAIHCKGAVLSHLYRYLQHNDPPHEHSVRPMQGGPIRHVGSHLMHTRQNCHPYMLCTHQPPLQGPSHHWPA